MKAEPSSESPLTLSRSYLSRTIRACVAANPFHAAPCLQIPEHTSSTLSVALLEIAVQHVHEEEHTMKKQFDSAALIAQFAAKGGTVQKIETGVRAIESDRTIYAAMREGTRATADVIAQARASEARYHAEHDAAAEARYNGNYVTGTTGDGGVTVLRNNRSVRY